MGHGRGTAILPFGTGYGAYIRAYNGVGYGAYCFVLFDTVP